MNQFEQFQNALVLEVISENTYKVNPDSRYFVGKTPHGGYLNALMHKALISSVSHSVAISSSIQYLNRIEAKDIILEVEVFKVSRGSSSGMVKLTQDNKICSVFNAICSDFDHMKGFDGLETNPPDIFRDMPMEKYKELNYDKVSLGLTPSFMLQLNCKIHPRHAWWDRDINENNAEARCSSYMKLDGGIPDQFALSFYVDVAPPVVSNKYGPLGWIPTYSLSTHIRQMPTTEIVFADFVAKDINKGYFEQDCNIWDLNENLVASSRQLTRILKSEEKLSN
jgi:hypothetical protein